MKPSDLRPHAPLQLLLRAASHRDAVLPEGLDDATLRSRPEAGAGLGSDLSGYLWDEGADGNDLRAQRWGVVAPAGASGDRLLARIQPLLSARQAEQAAPVRIYRPPPQLDELQAAQYRKDHYDTGRELVAGTPRYLLILGDLDEVPLSLQQVLQTDALVGRLAFTEPEGYEAYVDKVLQSQARARSESGQALFYAVPDGTAATQVGDTALVSPSFELADSSRAAGEFPGEVRSLNQDSADRLSPDVLLSAARGPQPTALLSVSHGEGAPTGGFRSPVRKRERQGAMCFGDDEALAGADLRERRFLAQGLWLMVACYGAGTPNYSAYQPWIEHLGRGAQNAELARLLAGLPRPDERPFIAALPQALLANPGGPLAFIGHIDLAWTYSFADLDAGPHAIPRPARFVEALRAALRGDRVGLCCRELMRALGQTQTEILALSQQLTAQQLTAQQLTAQQLTAQRQGPARSELPRAAPTPRRSTGYDPSTRLGHLWMLRQDLLGYILLGDPAVRLPIARPAATAPQSTHELAASLGLFGSPDADARPRSRGAPPGRTAPAVGAASLGLPIERLEAAIGAALAGNHDLQQIALQLGLSLAQFVDLVDCYRQAGRLALQARRKT